MAKNDAVETVTLEDYVPAPAAGKYDTYITAMLEADAKIQEEDPEGFTAGRRKAATIASPSRKGTRTVNGKETEVDLEVEKTRREFQDSARAHDRTAKLVGQTPQGDGTIALRFILVPKQARPRKPAEGDVPVES